MAGRAGTDTEEPFTEAQENRLAALIGEAIRGATPKNPPKSSGSSGEQPPTDDEWANMGPRARESYMEGAVGRILGQMRRDEKVEALEAEVARLKGGEAAGAPAGGAKSEKAPSVLTALGRFLWGDPAEGGEA